MGHQLQKPRMAVVVFAKAEVDALIFGFVRES
jgi:hypothetical protein